MIYNLIFDLDSRATSDDANGDDNKQMNHVFKNLRSSQKKKKILKAISVTLRFR